MNIEEAEISIDITNRDLVKININDIALWLVDNRTIAKYHDGRIYFDSIEDRIIFKIRFGL